MHLIMKSISKSGKLLKICKVAETAFWPSTGTAPPVLMMAGQRKATGREGKKMEEVKMQYRDYKRHYANCETVRGSYDASSKTIIVLVPASMMQPKRSASRFDSERFGGVGRCLCLPTWGAPRALSQQDHSRLWPRR